MKRIIITLIFALLFFNVSEKVNAQCKQQMVYQCATKSNKAIYLRDFNTKLKLGKHGDETGTKWTVVLNKGTQYRFGLCTPEGYEDKVVLTLYDSDHPEKEKPYGSTYFQGKDLQAFNFVCQKTGMYYVSIRFKEDAKLENRAKTCGVGILYFVGKNK